MSKNESRRERRERENNTSEDKNNGSGISKVYYWIIGGLFVILIGLVIFIFSQSGDDMNLAGEEDQSALVEDSESDSAENTADEEANQEEQATSTDETNDENQEQDTEEPADETEDTADTEDTEETTDSEEDQEDTETDQTAGVNADAPLDESYAVDYSEGSADRVEIKQRVMEVTGLEDDLIEHWIGNNGPGRVVATVSDREQTERYEVYLQYGDGSWHVTNYQQLN